MFVSLLNKINTKVIKVNQKTIVQMSELKIIRLRDKLPRGAISDLARESKLSKTAIGLIADGELDRPEIYAKMVVLAEKEKIRRDIAEKLKAESYEKASKL